ncbi:MAG: metal-dependent hydrolase [Rickettsiales bacterium]|jgi:inner membrane protein|nr:metal-dependent hydrolase [Rickettsiales bacterium]
MDPFSQALLGSVFSSCFAQKIKKTKKAQKSKIKTAAFCGAIGGVAADLDVLIKSSHDSLFAIEYHRHFTHSIFFIPFGGLIIATLLWLIFYRNKIGYKAIYLFTTIGYATHGILDSLTSYGTSLFWPISSARISLNIISIVDPIFTSILLITLIVTLIKKSSKAAIYGLLITILYLSFGYYQKHQVNNFMHDIANSRGHKIERSLLKPTIGNNILWRSVYQSDNYYYVDAVRKTPFSGFLFKEGARVNTIDPNKVFPEFLENSKQRDDIKKFAAFSQNYIYLLADQGNVIGDLRYGTLPYDLRTLWGLKVNPAPNTPSTFLKLGNFQENDYIEFKEMLKGQF